MKGYRTTYAGLFEERRDDAPAIDRIEIPLIQRDYAQGRADPDVVEIRTSFLEVLLEAVAGGEPVGLDFVYGKVESGTLHPLDGQQRLTTLFLLHWYLGSAAERLDPSAAWTAFSYATRPSARLFCQRLVANPLPADALTPSGWITDQEWYLYVWRNDPSIQAMLVMVDAIHEAVGDRAPRLDAHEAWERLTDEKSPAISFYLLPLDDMESDEDLYINMNSRGKPLTPFENFKAGFEQDIAYAKQEADDFAHRIDGPWADLMWPFHGGDNIVDDEFMRYIEFITELCELREGRLTSERLGRRARAVFGVGNERGLEHLGFLFAAFDSWTDADHIRSTFDDLFGTALPGDDSYDGAKVALFGATDTNLFEQCCRSFDSAPRRNPPFTLQQGLLLYGVLVHLIEHQTDFAEHRAELTRRMRVLRNLVAASDDEVRRENMADLVADVEQVVIHGDLEAVSRFSSNQVEDERLKRQFLAAHPELAGVLFRLEDSPILRGTLGCFELDADGFRSRAEAFETAFDDPDTWPALTGALLATGDYQRRRHRSDAWQFGAGSSKNEGVWRELLTNAPRADLATTRTVLGEFLDGLAASGRPVDEYADALTGAWLAEREAVERFDWRYYLVKYPSMREGTTGIYYGVEGVLGYSMCMLRTKTLGGYYRDPILLEIWEASEAGDLVDDPWFTGSESRPRWLRLVRSQMGLRSVADGFELEPPETADLAAVFEGICGQRADVVADGDRTVLRIPQVDDGEGAIDRVDRVLVGAAFLRTLVEAGL